MRDKRIKLIYFSLKGSDVSYIELSWKKMFFFASAFLVFLFIIVGSVIGLFTNYYQNFKIESLDKVNLTLTTQLQEMKDKVVVVQLKMKELEDKDDENRMIVGLDKIDKDMRKVGVGGADFGYSDEFNILTDETREDVYDTKNLIDQLERRVQLLVKSKAYIYKKVEEDQDKLKHTPSIRPVQGGRISDTFGWRLDPFTEEVKAHHGIDIAARSGTLVKASAAGVVELVRDYYTRNKGYGKEIIINHSGNIKTRYAHLKDIKVRRGQEIKRWEDIGSVGQTGRSTGPHLHYEVIVNGVKVDPAKYILE